MIIFAIDPGGTTGFARANFADGKLPEVRAWMSAGFLDAAYTISHEIEFTPPPDLIVVEKFTITSATGRKSTGGSNTAIELIGVARFLASFWCVPLEEQAPVDAKMFCDDKKLRRVGLYTPGPDHARDATRHLLLAAVRHEVIDLTQLIPQV